MGAGQEILDAVEMEEEADFQEDQAFLKAQEIRNANLFEFTGTPGWRWMKVQIGEQIKDYQEKLTSEVTPDDVVSIALCQSAIQIMRQVVYMPSNALDALAKYEQLQEAKTANTAFMRGDMEI